MAKIHRGVSLYSYQQAQFFGQMNWKAMIKAVHDLGCDGVEIINEATIPGYPFPTEQFLFDWNNEMARWGMKATVSDVFFDTLQFRDHVMNYREGAERLKYDIRLAAKMGFQSIRYLGSLPFEMIKLAMPEAEKYNMPLGREIHVPEAIHGPLADEVVEFVEATGNKLATIVVDMSTFQHGAPRIAIDEAKRHDSGLAEILEYIVENRKNMSEKELIAKVEEKYPQTTKIGFEHKTVATRYVDMYSEKMDSDPKDMVYIAPYLSSIHGKFYEMTEIPGKPGQYEDKVIDYENPIKYLKQTNWEGYIDSEYEGQRSQQDRGIEFLADEVKEVRRHHEMLKRLIGE